MWGKILTGYEQLKKVPYPKYNDHYQIHKESILKAIDHLTEFGIPVYIGKSRLYVPGMPSTKEECLSNKLLASRLYQNGIHPDMADHVLSAIDASMFDMHNNLEEITAVYLKRIGNIKNAANFISASLSEKMKMIKEAKIISTRIVTQEEREAKEKARKDDILDIIERHTRQRILRFP
jgi:hypothetical protein